MPKKLFLIPTILILFLILASVGFAFYEGVYGGYTGVSSRERRLFDPYSRIQYYGIGYPGYLGGYGQKGPVYGTIVGTGSKSAYSGVFQLDTSAFTRYGRSPKRTSHYDPGMRGYSRIDKIVELLPIQTLLERDYVVRMPKGTARILSLGGIYGAGRNVQGPESTVILHIINMPPIGDDEIYEAWVVDEESGYPLSMGLIKTGIGGTARLKFEINLRLENFDFIIITKEPFPDMDPRPGEIILLGDIPQPRTVISVPPSQIPTTTR